MMRGELKGVIEGKMDELIKKLWLQICNHLRKSEDYIIEKTIEKMIFVLEKLDENPEFAKKVAKIVDKIRNELEKIEKAREGASNIEENDSFSQ